MWRRASRPIDGKMILKQASADALSGLAAGAMVSSGDALSGIHGDFGQRGRQHCGVPALQAQPRGP